MPKAIEEIIPGILARKWKGCLWKNKKEKLSLRRKAILRGWKERLIQAAEEVVVELHLAASWRGCWSSERGGPWVITAVEGELKQPGP